MFCKECQSEQKTSKVYLLKKEKKKDRKKVIFWDHHGQGHEHDKTLIIYHLQCSNGHLFTSSRKKRCWCGWGFGLEIQQEEEYSSGTSEK